jgi:hypothetical protein
MIFAFTWRNMIALDGYQPKTETSRIAMPNQVLRYFTWLGGADPLYGAAKPSGAWTRPVLMNCDPRTGHMRIKYQADLPARDAVTYTIQTGYPPSGGVSVGRFIIRDIWSQAINTITEEDALAEGCEALAEDSVIVPTPVSALDQFAVLWDSIHFANRAPAYYRKNMFSAGPICWRFRFDVIEVYWDIVDKVLAADGNKH